MNSGTLLRNRYLIKGTLGKGGMGSVYQAVDQSLGVQVAIKENRFSNEEYTRQFKREAVILANLRHPNLPRVTDHFVIEDQGQYLVMDFIEGSDLKEIISSEGQLDEITVRKIGAAVADAIGYLHSLNPPVIHRDIKPSNIKITPKGEVFLVDFGLAKQITGPQETTTGAQGLTPGYSPPEQYGSARTDPRSDIYSLGATLYVSLTGEAPAEGMKRALNKESLTPVREHNRDASRELAAALEKSLAVHPNDRYQSAVELQDVLSAAGEGQVESDAAKTRPHKNRSQQEQAQPTADDFSSRPTIGSQAEKRKLAVPLLLLGGLGLLAVCGVVIIVGLQMILRGDDPAATAALTTAVPSRISAPTFTLEPAAVNTQTLAPTEEVSSTETQQPTDIVDRTPTASAEAQTIEAVPLMGGSAEIAFVSDRTGLPQIYIISLSGADDIQVTTAAEGACQPSWSPDGEWIAYTSPCSGSLQQYPGAGIYAVRADGSENYRLMTVPGGDYDPAWSPDGTKLAFTTLRESSRPQIWVYEFKTGEERPVSQNLSFDHSPSWAPDSFNLAFVSTRAGSKSEIWVMDINGENIGLFSRNADFYNSAPDWSPDGTIITYTQTRSASGIPYLVEASWNNGDSSRGYDERRAAAANIAEPMREASSSPDMKWLAYEGYPTGTNHDIFLISSTGVEVVKLTEHEAFEFDPAWKPQP